MKKLILSLSFVLLSSQTLYAQSVYTGVKIYTGKGEVIENGSLSIDKDGKIENIEAGAKVVKNPKLTYDFSGKVLTPGFIDVGTELGLTEIWAVKASNHTGAGNLDRDKDVIQPGYLAADGFNPNASAIPLSRTGGITSVLVNPEGGLISGQSAWIDLKGSQNTHASVKNNSVAIHVSLNARAARKVGGSTAGVVQLLREAFEDTVFLMKNTKALDGTRGKKSTLSRQDVLALKKGLSGNIPIIFHVSKAADILTTLKLADTYGFKLIISGGEEAWMVADALAKAKVAVILNPFANLPSSFDKLGTRIDNAKLLHAAKVEVLLSTFEGHNVRNLRFAAGNAVRAGLPYQVAMSAITSTPAKNFGANNVGSIEKGKLANFVIWSGDPFEPSSFVEAMIIEGERVSLDNRQEALFRKYRKLQRRGVVPAKTPLKKEEKKKEKK